jgi:hypothetical protein
MIEKLAPIIGMHVLLYMSFEHNGVPFATS